MNEEIISENKIKPIKENKMGTLPINKLLISMSFPMMLSMLVQALYNIVDSMFVAQWNKDAFTAVNLAFPIQTLMISVGIGTGVGVNAVLSKSLGEKNYDVVNKSANNSLFLSMLNYLVFAVLGGVFSNLFFSIQTADADVIKYATTYLVICTVGSLGIFYQVTFEKLLQSTGKTFYTMITQIVGAVINIILDYILIFGKFGFPEMGVAGAAWATIIGQTIAALLNLYFNLRKNKEISLSLRNFRPNWGIIRRIYSVGFPSIIMASLGSVMVFGLNKIVIRFSDTAVNVVGAYFKLQSFIFMPAFGLNNGMVPIVSYNFGARNKERIIKTAKLSFIYESIITISGIIIFWVFSPQLLSLFNPSDEMLEIGQIALKIISISYLFSGINICALSICQALGHGFLSLSVSFVRQIVMLIPSAFILSLIGNVNSVWWSFPLAELVACTMCIMFLKHLYNKEIRHL